MNRKPQEQPKRPQVTDFDRKMHALFNSTVGKEVKRVLEGIFFNNSTFVAGDPHYTSYKVGQQDVIGFINESMYLVETEPSSIISVGG